MRMTQGRNQRKRNQCSGLEKKEQLKGEARLTKRAGIGKEKEKEEREDARMQEARGRSHRNGNESEEYSKKGIELKPCIEEV